MTVDFDGKFDASIEGAVQMEAAALDKLLMYHPLEGIIQRMMGNQNPLP